MMRGQMVIFAFLIWLVLLFIIVFMMPTIQGIVGEQIAETPMFQIIPFALWFIVGFFLFRSMRTSA